VAQHWQCLAVFSNAVARANVVASPDAQKHTLED